MRWPSPNQLEDAGKVIGAVTVASGAVLKFWKPVRTRIQAYFARRAAKKAAAIQAQVDALIEAQRQAAVAVAAETKSQLEEVYRMGQVHMLESLADIQTLMTGFDAWKGEHTLSDDDQFRSVKQSQEKLQAGQHETHEALREMRSTLTKLDEKLDVTRESMFRIDGRLDGIVNGRRHE